MLEPEDEPADVAAGVRRVSRRDGGFEREVWPTVRVHESIRQDPLSSFQPFVFRVDQRKLTVIGIARLYELHLVLVR